MFGHTVDSFIGQIQLIGSSVPGLRTVDQPVAQVRKDSGEAHLDYLMIIMEN